MKKWLPIALVLLSIIALLIRFQEPIAADLLNINSRAGIKVTSTPQATVYFEGVEVGKTPYLNENLEVKEYPLKLVADNGGVWQGSVKLTPGTLSVINRELSESIASSSGETLILDGGKGFSVISSPSGAIVEVDGTTYGKTPLLIDLPPGEYTFILSHPNYLKRSIRVNLPEKMVLNLAVDLAISEINLTQNPAPQVTTIAKVVVKPTSTGFLRVRNKPSLTGQEIDRIKSGQSLILLEELSSGWMKVGLDNGVEGYISSEYVSKE